jgi:hypothetical protein
MGPDLWPVAVLPQPITRSQFTHPMPTRQRGRSCTIRGVTKQFAGEIERAGSSSRIAWHLASAYSGKPDEASSHLCCVEGATAAGICKTSGYRQVGRVRLSQLAQFRRVADRPSEGCLRAVVVFRNVHEPTFWVGQGAGIVRRHTPSRISMNARRIANGS